jgi:hypothetical protein
VPKHDPGTIFERTSDQFLISRHKERITNHSLIKNINYTVKDNTIKFQITPLTNNKVKQLTNEHSNIEQQQSSPIPFTQRILSKMKTIGTSLTQCFWQSWWWYRPKIMSQPRPVQAQSETNSNYYNLYWYFILYSIFFAYYHISKFNFSIIYLA